MDKEKFDAEIANEVSEIRKSRGWWVPYIPDNMVEPVAEAVVFKNNNLPSIPEIQKGEQLRASLRRRSFC